MTQIGSTVVLKKLLSQTKVGSLQRPDYNEARGLCGRVHATRFRH